MNVVLLSPGFPAEMPLFAAGLARVGATVIGVGDQHVDDLPEAARVALSRYIQVDFGDPDGAIGRTHEAVRGTDVERIESLWEPLMLLAARMRAAFGVPGMSVEQTLPFRDKEEMKRVLDAAGIRTPRHQRATTADECRAAAQQIGFPLIIKPIAGAGSVDTHRVEDEHELEGAIAAVRHVPEVSVEEFVDGEEFTFDTVCARGEVLFHNVCWYRPRPLVSRQHEWISPQTIALREPDAEHTAPGVAMGRAVLQAMGFTDGFTHMEWYRTADGEAVFGEIGARPPGARTVDVMNFANDIDLFTGWAEAVCHGWLSQPVNRPYNAASIFKRAQGQGRIQRIEGLGPLLAEHGEHIPLVDLLPIGAPRRDWQQTVVSDGEIVVRHADLATTIELADRVAVEVQLYAG